MIIYSIHPINPQRRLIESTARICKEAAGIAVYPTDTVYGMGVNLSNAKAIEKISRMLNKDHKRLFSFLCSDFSQMSRYAKVSNSYFKLMKRYLPGPYTFILPATNLVPKKICPKRKTVGVRIPDCRTILDLISVLGEPIANTSLNLPGESRGDSNVIRPAIFNEVDVMLDIGPLSSPINSTIVDLTGDEPVLIREGKGNWHE